MGDRAMVEATLVAAVEEVMMEPTATVNERQLGRLVLDLLEHGGDHPAVVQYLNMTAGAALNEEHPWGGHSS